MNLGGMNRSKQRGLKQVIQGRRKGTLSSEGLFFGERCRFKLHQLYSLSYSRLQNLGRGRSFFQINVFVIRTGNISLEGTCTALGLVADQDTYILYTSSLWRWVLRSRIGCWHILRLVSWL